MAATTTTPTFDATTLTAGEAREKDREDLLYITRRGVTGLPMALQIEAVRAFDEDGYTAAVVGYSLLAIMTKPRPQRTVTYFRGILRAQRRRQGLAV